MDLETLSILIIAGFVAAFFDAIVGGGGLIATPSLMLTGLPIHNVLGTNKLAALMSNVSSIYGFWKAGKIDFKALKVPSIISFFMSMLGASLALAISVDFLKNFIVIMLVIVAAYTIFKKDMGEVSSFTNNRKSNLIICGSTFILGFYDGFFGPGSGSFWTFAFIIAGLDFVSAAASTRVVNLMSVIASTIVFGVNGNINIVYGLIMGTSMMVGAYMGTKFALNRGLKVIKPMYLCVTITLISKQLYDIFCR